MYLICSAFNGGYGLWTMKGAQKRKRVRKSAVNKEVTKSRKIKKHYYNCAQCCFVMISAEDNLP